MKWTQVEDLVFFIFSNTYHTHFWLWGITQLFVYLSTLSILSDPTDHHCETKSDHRWINRDSQLTCTVQSMTVIFSHRWKLVYFVYFPLQSLSQPYDTCVRRQLSYILPFERTGGFEEANMTAAVSHTFLRTSACVIISVWLSFSWGPNIMKAFNICGG